MFKFFSGSQLLSDFQTFVFKSTPSYPIIYKTRYHTSSPAAPVGDIGENGSVEESTDSDRGAAAIWSHSSGSMALRNLQI